MRRRLVISTIAIVLVVLGALAAPIGRVVYDAAEGQLDARLEQQAQSVVETYERALVLGEEPTDESLLAFIGRSDGLLIIQSDDSRSIQDLDPDASSTLVKDTVASDGTRFRLSTASDPLDEDFRRQLRILLMLAFGAILAAAGLAAVQARQLARPLERLALRAGSTYRGARRVGGMRSRGCVRGTDRRSR